MAESGRALLVANPGREYRYRRRCDSPAPVVIDRFYLANAVARRALGRSDRVGLQPRPSDRRAATARYSPVAHCGAVKEFGCFGDAGDVAFGFV